MNELVKRCVEEHIRREYTLKGKVFANFCPDRQRAIRTAAAARFGAMTEEELESYLTENPENATIKA